MTNLKEQQFLTSKARVEDNFLTFVAPVDNDVFGGRTTPEQQQQAADSLRQQLDANYADAVNAAAAADRARTTGEIADLATVILATILVIGVLLVSKRISSRVLANRKQARLGSKQENLNLSERNELDMLRKENAKLLMEKEMIKKAAIFFAKESE